MRNQTGVPNNPLGECRLCDIDSVPYDSSINTDLLFGDSQSLIQSKLTLADFVNSLNIL